jgi:hypothetical protein
MLEYLVSSHLSLIYTRYMGVEMLEHLNQLHSFNCSLLQPYRKLYNHSRSRCTWLH